MLSKILGIQVSLRKILFSVVEPTGVYHVSSATERGEILLRLSSLELIGNLNNVGGLDLANGSRLEHKMANKIGFRKWIEFRKEVAFIENMVQKDKAQLG